MEVSTIAMVYGPAMIITDEEEAKKYFDNLVAINMEQTGNSLIKATKQEKDNLGYYAGYFDEETRKRVWKLFDCAHPFFGRRTDISPDEAFEMGKKIALGLYSRGNTYEPRKDVRNTDDEL